MVDRALDALVERELEKKWLGTHAGAAVTGPGLPDDVPVDLSDVPWEPS